MVNRRFRMTEARNIYTLLALRNLIDTSNDLMLFFRLLMIIAIKSMCVNAMSCLMTKFIPLKSSVTKKALYYRYTIPKAMVIYVASSLTR